MTKYRDQLQTMESHITTLRFVIGFLSLVIIGLWSGWNSASETLRVHIPPDLRSGANLAHDAVHPANVYAFAGYILQQLNHWQSNGSKEYPERIYALAAYFTHSYRSQLITQMELSSKQGELSDRSRSIQALPGSTYEERRVDVLSADSWLVWLDYQIIEHVRGMEVKNVKIRYPVRVVRYPIDPEQNPWGLALDGYGGDGPRRLTDVELKTEQTTQPQQVAS